MTPGRPDQIGPYRRIRTLGTGGMGTVVLAQDPKLPRPVAVKRLTNVDPELQARFLAEASHMAELQHPHLLPVLDIGSDGGALYIVMPFMAGGSVEDLVSRRGPAPPAQVVTILAATAEALAAMHSHGVIHRDVKPSNVLLSENGDVYLGDLGLAWTVDSTRHTAAGGFAGTLGYTAPEIVAGADPSAATDTFSLGALGYFLLTGRPPFHGDSMADVVRQAADGDCMPITSAAPGAPGGLTHAIEGAMTTDPALRPRSLLAWARELRSAVGPEPVPVWTEPEPRTPRQIAALPCPACGAQALASDLHCGTCGAHLGHIPSPSPPSAAPPLPAPPPLSRGPAVTAAEATMVRSRPVAARDVAVPAQGRRPATALLAATAAGVVVALGAIVLALVLLADRYGSGGNDSAPDTSAVATTAVPSLQTTVAAPAPVATPPPPTSAPTRQARVTRTCGPTGRGDCFLSIRTGPTTRAPEVRRAPEADTVGVVCQVRGDSVRSAILGSPTTVWVRDETGNYMTAAFLDAPGWDPLTITTPC